MKKRITIGMFVDTFFPFIDGVAMVVDNYAKRLSKYANVIVFAPNYKGKHIDDTIYPYKIVRCNSLKLFFVDYNLPIPNLDKKFKKIINNYKLDIIHIHSPFTIGKIGIRYAEKHHIPLIGTMHSQYKQDFRRATKSNIMANILTKVIIKEYNKCDECWTVNNKIADIYINDYGYKGKIKIINNATDMKLLCNDRKARTIINKKHHLQDNDKVLLFVGRINKLKNVFFIIDSLQELEKIKNNLNYKMLFIGTGQDEEKLKKYVNKCNLENKVIFCGKITDRELLKAYYKRADLFLFPSFYDTNSLVQIEAASQKTPTLFIAGSGTSFMVTNNINGFISDYKSKTYAEKIINILTDEKLYEKVSENVYNDLYKYWDNIVDEVFNNYNILITKNNK